MTAVHGSPVACIATGIYCLRTGWWRLASNVYLVESGSSWVLVDTGWPGQAEVIRSAAESLFGGGTRPAAILLTHVHPDHSGAAAELGRCWHVPVYVHPAEVPQAAGGIVPGRENPLDRVLLAPALRLLPRRLHPARDPLADIVRELEPDASPPGLPDWRCIPAPGHTPGSLAFFRPADRVLLTGDAILTVDPNSVRDLLCDRPVLAGPPWISTWNWAQARESVARLAELEPALIAAGHGRAMTGSASAVAALATRMHRPLPAADPSQAQLRAAADRHPIFLVQEEPNRATKARSDPHPATLRASTSTAPGGRLGPVLLAASAAGAPLSLLALRHLGRWGHILVASGCAVLFVRDTTMVTSGTPARLRPLPRALLAAEVATSATAVATGVATGAWPWLQHPSTTADRRHHPRSVPPRLHSSQRTAVAPLRAAACATLVIHTTRFAIYLSPGSGLRSPSRPTDPSPAAWPSPATGATRQRVGGVL